MTGPGIRLTGEETSQARRSRANFAAPIIIVLFLIAGLLHIQSTPLGFTGIQDAPDEAAHVSYIQTLVAGQMPTHIHPHGGVTSGYPDYEWHQPPLYYGLSVAPYIFGQRAVRVLSLMFGLCSLLFIFNAARRLKPQDDLAAIVALGVAALIPGHIALLSSVNNDSLLELCFSGVLYYVTKAFTDRLTMRDAFVTGLLLGAALLTKTTSILLVPILLIAGWRYSADHKDAGISVDRRLQIAIVTPAVLISGWWFVRNGLLYGELLPLTAFRQSFGGTALASQVVDGGLGLNVHGWPQYWSLVACWCFKSFWAVYGTVRSAAVGAPLWLSDEVYWLMLAVCVAAAAGMARLHFRRDAEFTKGAQRAIQVQQIALGLTLAAYLLFASRYFQTQGRYLYPAMLPISISLAFGWLALFPVQYRRIAAAGLVTLIGLVCAVFLVQTATRTVPAAISSRHLRVHGTIVGAKTSETLRRQPAVHLRQRPAGLHYMA